MRSRFIIGVLILWASAAAVLATPGDGQPRRQSAVITFARSTWVTDQLLVGTYVVVHDEDKMARGEPCTTFYRVGAAEERLNEVVSFHCIPRERRVVRSFTMTVSSDPALGADTLTEYQFGGDSEGHGVPLLRWTNDVSHTQTPVTCTR